MGDPRSGSYEATVALFGFGRIGQVHFRNLVDYLKVDVRYVVDELVEECKTRLSRYAGVTVLHTSQSDTVYQDPLVEAVFVCTPSFTHRDIVHSALQAGKAVFCEKPLAPSLEEIRLCYKLADQVNKSLFCAFNRRFDPQLQALHTCITSGDVGELRVIKTTSRDPPGHASKQYIQSSGGIFLDSAIHDIDLVCWLAGSVPTTVYATGAATISLYEECDDVDTCSITLTFPNGVIGHIEVTRNAPHGYDQRVEILGSKSMIQSNNHHKSNVVTWDAQGSRSDPIYQDCIQRYKESYKQEIKHFISCLSDTGDVQLNVTAKTTILANTIACACVASLKTGQCVNITDLL